MNNSLLADTSDIIQFSSLKHFANVYAPVSDEIYLFEPASGIIEASNYSPHHLAIDSKKGKSFIEEFNIDPSIGEEGVPLKIGIAESGGKGSLSVSITSVLVAGNLYKMAVVSKEEVPSTCVADEEAEKSALLNEVYHRVKNNLNIIVSLLSLQIKRIPDPASRHKLIESKSRIYTLSLLQQNLYNSPRISEIKAGHYLHSLALSILATFKLPGSSIRLKTELEDRWLNIDTLMPLGLIVHELISNAVLHAFNEQEDGEIEIIFRQLSSGRLQLCVKDNGQGLPAGKQPEEYDTLGFLLVHSLVKQLNAELSFGNKMKSGCWFTIEFEEVLK